MQLESFLERSARRLPEKTALVCEGRRWTYAELDGLANRVAQGLIRLGLERGDRVAVCLENSAECVVAIFAALKAGGVFMPLNPTVKGDKLAYILGNSRAHTLVTTRAKIDELTGRELPHLRVVVERGGKSGETGVRSEERGARSGESADLGTGDSSSEFRVPGSEFPVPSSEYLEPREPRNPGTLEPPGTPEPRNLGTPKAEPATPRSSVPWAELVDRPFDGPPPKRAIDVDLAALIYTSGSTGNPKGVMLNHLNMVAAATSITTYLENREDDVILNVLPLSFDYGLYQVLMAFKFGGTVVLERSMAYPYVLIDRLVQEGITGFPIVPTLLSILFRLDLTRYEFPRLRYVTNTGAALPGAHIRRLRELFPDVRVYSMYGLTECKRVAYLPPELIDERPDSVGRAMPNVEVYLVDDQGKRLPPGSTGELVVRGSNVMKGYWELPEETERMLKPGPLPGEMVLHTGDLFLMDEEGWLYFRGRKDDIIKSRGEKVSPREVENVLYGLEGVADAAVIGVEDPILGQAVKAFVTLRENVGLKERDVLRHCASLLEDFMVPKFVEIRDELPKNASGKIDKRRLG